MMNIFFKKTVIVVVILVVTVTMLSGDHLFVDAAYADTKIKQTYDVYLPQKEFLISSDIDYTVTKASSSDSTVAEAKIRDGKAYLYPKQAGSTIVTFKEKKKKKKKVVRKTIRHRINVKDLPENCFTTEIVPVHTTKTKSDRYMFSIVNNSDVCFYKAVYHYTLYSASDEVIDNGETIFYNVHPGYTSYSAPFYVLKSKNIDVTKTRLELQDLTFYDFEKNVYPEENYKFRTVEINDENRTKVKMLGVDNYGDKEADIILQVIFKYPDGKIFVQSSGYINVYAGEKTSGMSTTFNAYGWESYELHTTAVVIDYDKL